MLHDENPPDIDLQRIAVRNPDIGYLLWSNRPISAFFGPESAASPFLNVGSKEVWKSFRNSNLSCERLIGYIKNCIVNKNLRDSQDQQSDEELKVFDQRVLEFINHGYYS